MVCNNLWISIPALREEGDIISNANKKLLLNFYPRPPRGGRPVPSALRHVWSRFLSPPSARRATTPSAPALLEIMISIPALREEGDSRCLAYRPYIPISIPALREEGDSSAYSSYVNSYAFLSPPSARRATGRREPPKACTGISIPALREEGDPRRRKSLTRVVKFLSPPSARRATYMPEVFHDVMKFLSPPSARRATKP